MARLKKQDSVNSRVKNKPQNKLKAISKKTSKETAIKKDLLVRSSINFVKKMRDKANLSNVLQSECVMETPSNKKINYVSLKVKPGLNGEDTFNKVHHRECSKKRVDISHSPLYSTPKDLDKDIIKKTVDSMLKINEIKSNKATLFNQETVIFLQIVCVKIPECRDRIVRFKLPHSLVTATSEVCLIVADKKKGKRFDHEPQIEYWKDLLEEKGVTEVKTVLPMRQLKVEFDQYELKRRLKTMHDFFLVDAKICGHVSHILGKIFRDKNVIPTPVRIGKDEQNELKKTIKYGLHKTPLRIHSAVSTATLRVGHIDMKQRHLCENIKAVIDQLDLLYPGGSENVRALYLKTPLSLAIPLYVTLKPASSVQTPQIEPKHPKLYKTLEDELSTVPNARVQVDADGSVKLLRMPDITESDPESLPDDENSKPTRNNAKPRRNNYITPLSDTSQLMLDDDDSNAEDDVSDDDDQEKLDDTDSGDAYN